MKPANLKTMTVDQLVERFAEIGVAQDKSLQEGEYWIEGYINHELNQLFAQMHEIDTELRSRGLDARLALRQLYHHPNTQVRLLAAKCTLGVAPVVARKVVQAIADSKLPPQAMDAGMTLSNLDKGRFKPD
jgi:hypothetical protein